MNTIPEIKPKPPRVPLGFSAPGNPKTADQIVIAGKEPSK